MKKSVDLCRSYATILTTLGIFILLTSFVFAVSSQPQGPTGFRTAGSSRYQNNSNAVVIQADAGNVTALIINNTRNTEAWQGYYGNITGKVTLSDANNQTLYDWSLPNPTGEVYASNGSGVTWSKVYCMNVSYLRGVNNSGSVVYSVNSTQIELLYGINVTDVDGLNETFNDTYTSVLGFKTGATSFTTSNGCSLTHPYTSTIYSNAWEELLLSDNESIIFTSLIRKGADGFQSGTTDIYDFQMLVLENGHVGQESTLTNYYFYVELA